MVWMSYIHKPLDVRAKREHYARTVRRYRCPQDALGSAPSRGASAGDVNSIGPTITLEVVVRSASGAIVCFLDGSPGTRDAERAVVEVEEYGSDERRRACAARKNPPGLTEMMEP